MPHSSMRMSIGVSGTCGVCGGGGSGKPKDLFKSVATRLFKTSYDAVSDEMRAAVKAVVYAQLYGAGIKSVAENNGLPEDDVRRVVEQWRKMYPTVQTYFEGVKRACRKLGYITTLSGRRRYLPEIASTDPRRHAAACRQAINSTVQGSAADLIKQAMLRIDAELTPQAHGCGSSGGTGGGGGCSQAASQEAGSSQAAGSLDSEDAMSSEVAASQAYAAAHAAAGPALPTARRGRLLLQIHDELLFEVEEAHASELQAIVRAAMQEATWAGGEPLLVPLRVSLKQGRSWGTLKLVEEVETMTQEPRASQP